MGRRSFFAVLVLVDALMRAEAVKTWLDKYRGSARPEAIVQTGHARFSVLTSSVIRMEYSIKHEFDDAPTVNIINRHTDTVPTFTVLREPGSSVVTISTDGLELRYDAAADVAAGSASAAVDHDGRQAGLEETAASGPGFHAGNLQVTLKTYPFTVWRPGTAGTGNLHGTIRTLDRVGESVDLTCIQVGVILQVQMIAIAWTATGVVLRRYSRAQAYHYLEQGLSSLAVLVLLLL